MSDHLTEITCSRCGHTWYQDLARLDEKDLVVYKDEAQQKIYKTYRVRCPKCDTNNIVTVEFEEAEDEQSADR